jgi:hypothetical protein
VSGIIGRLIARGRAPLSSVRPLLPSRFEADRGRSAHGFERTALAIGSQATVPFEHAAGGGEPESTDAVTTSEAAGTRRGPATAFRPGAAPPAGGARIIASPGAGVAEDSRRARTVAPDEEADRTQAGDPAARDTEAAPAFDSAPRPHTFAPAGSARAAIRSAHEWDWGDRHDAVGRGLGAISAGYAADRPDTGGRAATTDSRSAPAPSRRDPAQGAAADEVARAGTTEVTISIGHIEVCAAPAPEPPRKPAVRPRVTLDEYLRRRETAGR